MNFQMQLVGTLCSTIANFSMNKKKSKTYKVKDFFKLIDQKKETKKQTSNEMASILEAFTIALGGEVKK